MKTLNEIKNSKDGEINEAGIGLSDPPTVVILKRKAIRVFPNGKRVALYHSDKLGIDVSLPYSKDSYQKEIPGINEELLLEKEHDDLFGSYTHALTMHYKTGATKVDHPELSKLKYTVHQKYGKKAAGHFHAAAENYLNGNVSSAMKHYHKFENAVNENYNDINLDVLEEAVIHRIHHIAKTKQSGDVVFGNGAKSRLEHPQAAHIMKLHTSCTPENKQKIEKLVHSSPAGLQKVSDFAAENLK
jgi:hypothetical protein